MPFELYMVQWNIWWWKFHVITGTYTTMSTGSVFPNETSCNATTSWSSYANLSPWWSRNWTTNVLWSGTSYYDFFTGISAFSLALNSQSLNFAYWETHISVHVINLLQLTKTPFTIWGFTFIIEGIAMYNKFIFISLLRIWVAYIIFLFFSRVLDNLNLLLYMPARVWLPAAAGSWNETWWSSDAQLLHANGSAGPATSWRETSWRDPAISAAAASSHDAAATPGSFPSQSH